MTNLLKATQKSRKCARTGDHLMTASASWPSTFQHSPFSSHLSQRFVSSINITFMLLENNFWSFENLIWYSSSCPECLTHLCSCKFFLGLRDLSNVPYFIFYGFQLGYTILCGFILDCGSAIIQRSSWSLYGFGASLCIAWSHLTFIRYKDSYPFCS